MVIRKQVKLSIWLMAIYALASVCTADISTSSGILLKRTTGIRAEGMGGAQAAVKTDEAAAACYNPSMLYGDPSTYFSALYIKGAIDDSFGALYYSMPYNEQLKIGGGLNFYNGGNFELNTNDTSSNVSAERDFLAIMTGAYQLKTLDQLFLIGANLKVFQSTLLNKYSAFAVALDIGAGYDIPGLPIHTGLVIKNIGTPVKYIETADALPFYTLLGVSVDAFQNENIVILLAWDAQYDFERVLRSNLGTEIKISNVFALRGGYQLGYDLSSITVGFGFNYNEFQLDYAFTPMQALESMHSISLKYTLDPGIRKEPELKPVVVEEPKYIPQDVEPEPSGPTQRVKVEILEIRKAGGRASVIIINVGSNQQIKPGIRGKLFDTEGRLLAGFKITQVDPQMSLANIIGLSKDIDMKAIAVIDIPVVQ